jgi:hypothetical protein
MAEPIIDDFLHEAHIDKGPQVEVLDGYEPRPDRSQTFEQAEQAYSSLDFEILPAEKAEPQPVEVESQPAITAFDAVLESEPSFESAHSPAKTDSESIEPASVETQIFGSFTAPKMWTSDETSAVEIDSSDERSINAPTGLEVTADETQAHDASALATVTDLSTPHDEKAVVSEQEMQVVEIPEALVEEIVRRVVAQLSDSVVREIAWEVVPDCVERIVRDMTRGEMSKRF